MMVVTVNGSESDFRSDSAEPLPHSFVVLLADWLHFQHSRVVMLDQSVSLSTYYFACLRAQATVP